MKVLCFGGGRQLTEEAAKLLLQGFQTRTDTPAAIMLSGGYTPLAAYEAVVRTGVKASESAHVLFSDERMAPPDSPDSNYGNAAGMIAALGIPDTRVIRVHTEVALDLAADQYDRDIASFFEKKGRVILGLLGLGPDGHTASLFSADEVERGRERWAIAVPRTDRLDRVSVSVQLIENVEQIVFLASGPEKAAIIQTVIQHPESIPAGLATAHAKNVELWTA